MRYAFLLLLLPLFLATACTPPTKAFILAGSSVTSNDDAVTEAQQALMNAQSNGCEAISLAGGTGAGVGLGIGVGYCDGDCVVERDSLVGSTFTVNVLVECPVNGPDLLPTGIATP